jgi:hypothetical protein
MGARRIYLHVPPENETIRTEIGSALKSDGIVLLTAQSSPGGDLMAWQREAKERIEMARRCEALTLLRVDNRERFVGDLLDIGVDEREHIESERGAPMPCAVLDKSGAGLPIDVTDFRIERFDVTRAEWRNEFRKWLDAARGRQAEVTP